ncbi:MAG: hypothetical protein EP329_27295 [Deltaproteobacteria bacterium]|nr:MAG: hypothetical protein EP329_27295 [Deltaproteobacteria bacterium]
MTKRLILWPLLLWPVACGGSAETAHDTFTADTAAVDATDTAGDDAGGTCADGDAAGCLYRPAITYEVAEPLTFEGITYTDVLGEERSVAVAVYRPIDAPSPAPVVVLSHGGAGGKTDPLRSMDQWAPVLARAGYVAVAIAHPGRDQDAYDRLCEALSVPDTIPCAVKIDWDRPHDVTRVLDWIEEQAAAGGPLEGRVDLTRLAHLGHSAGAGCAVMMSGAGRNYVCDQPYGNDQGAVVACDAADLVVLRDPRVAVAVALSPQGPGAAGFMTESFATVAIPLFTGTGAADGDDGEPDNRRGVYDALASSASGLDSTRLFVDDRAAKHTLFEGEIDACAGVAGATEARCREMRSWIFAAAVAFLDWHVRGREAAAAWLRSGDLATASAGTVTWETK